MTANELRDMLTEFCARNGGRNGENIVAVKTSPGGLCGTSCSDVTHLINGGDWSAGKLFLVTEDRLLKEGPKTK